MQPQPEPEPEAGGGGGGGDGAAGGGGAASTLGILPEGSVEFSEEIIGRGTQGIVTAGRYTLPDGQVRDVAVKKLADGATKREMGQFEKEFGIHWKASQRCPKACKLIGCVNHSGALCLIMERYEQSLYEFLDGKRDPNDDAKRAVLPPVQVVILAHQIAGGLSQIHTQNIVCNDLKPGNILMTAKGDLVISDFGLAAMVAVQRSIMRASTISHGAGTTPYMAPEQHDPDTFGEVSTKTDIWGLGCIILEMLTGAPPWPGRQPPNIQFLVAVKQQAPDIPDGLPNELQTALHNCFVHTQAGRSDADLVIKALQPIVDAEERKRAAAARAAAAASNPANAPGVGGISPALQGTVDALARQAQPTVGAPTDHELQTLMEKKGLSAAQQAVLLREGVRDEGALQLLEDEDFRLLGIYLPPAGAAAGGGAPPAPALPTAKERDELRDVLENEGHQISAEGRETLLGLIGNLTQLCLLSLETMQAIGLNVVDRRQLANLTLEQPGKPGTSVLKNFLVLQKSEPTKSISLEGLRMLGVQHKCTEYKDVLQLNYSVAAGFMDPNDRAVIGSLILTGGATEKLSAGGQDVLQRAGHTTADAVAALDSAALVALMQSDQCSLDPDASLLFTRGQSDKLSVAGLQFLATAKKLTLNEVHPLKTAAAERLGISTKDSYEINALRKHDGTLQPSWPMPTPSAAEAWVPRGGGRGSTFRAEPALLDEMVKRGLLPADQAKLVHEGVTTVDQLARMDSVAYGYLRINLQAATARAAAARQVTDAQRNELRTLLAQASPVDLSWESSEALVNYVGSINQLCELQLHTNLEHATSLGVRVNEARALHQLLFTVGLRVQWQQQAATHLQQHQRLTKAGADILGCGCDGVIAAKELAENVAMVAQLGLSAADVAAAKAAELVFTKGGPGLALGGPSVTGQSVGQQGHYPSAICDGAAMRVGRHYAEFRHLSGNYSHSVRVGIVEPSFNPSAGQAPQQGAYEAAAGTWMMMFNNGQMRHRQQNIPNWPGQDGQGTKQGTLGLLLDLNEGSLAVYKDGHKVGVALQPGSLVGPLFWAADVQCYTDGNAATHHGAVAIQAKPPPA